MTAEAVHVLLQHLNGFAMFSLDRRQFLQLSSTAFIGNTIDIRDSGARADGQTLATHAIQAAIDQAYDGGGGVVAVPPGTFLTGSLILRSRVTLHLAPGARLLGSPRVEDYRPNPGPPREGDANGRHLVFACDAEDIAIVGLGTIDGNGAAFWRRRHRPAPAPANLWADVIAWDYEAATPRRPSPDD